MNNINEQETLTNLIAAHNALSDVVNKHIEFTSTLANVVDNNDAHGSKMRIKIMKNIDTYRKTINIHIGILYICLMITMITIGWKLI